MAGTSIPASYAGAEKASNQKLTITRKESEADGGMDKMDLREVQTAITNRAHRRSQEGDWGDQSPPRFESAQFHKKYLKKDKMSKY